MTACGRGLISSLVGAFSRRKIGLSRRYHGQHPFYEVWFGKFVISRDEAFWFRYTILDGRTREAGVWAIYFRNDEVTGGKETWPLEMLTGSSRKVQSSSSTGDVANQEQVFHLGEAHLDSGSASGRAKMISWQLSWQAGARSFRHAPPLLQILPLAASAYETPFLDARFSGTITLGDKTTSVDRAPGMIGHIWGTKQARQWAWMQCNSFDDAADVVVEGLSVKLVVGSVELPALTSLVCFVGEHRFDFTFLPLMIATRSEWQRDRWHFSANNGFATLRGEVTLPLESPVALVTYTDTDGSNLWCCNSKLASLRLWLTCSRHGIDHSWTATRTVAFETVDRVAPSQAPLI